MKRHIEFFDIDHFEKNYHRVKPASSLIHFIDFFWETKFDKLLAQNPAGFSDALFPNVGYTYLINLGTPFTMQVGDKKFKMRSDGFLPRHESIECFHQPGNTLFGIKFKISPIIFQKKINFSEYAGYIFPLSYLMDVQVIDAVKKATTFKERVKLLNQYFQTIVADHSSSLKPVQIVKEILEYCDSNNAFHLPIDFFAEKYAVSLRTLQRYFETATGMSTKNILQVMRIRKATAHLALSPAGFDPAVYGYYDHSHFSKHLKQFLYKDSFAHLQLHLDLLARMRTKI